ncbi:MAG: hypothetical protein BGO70_15835 [Bacteroidetes bacterium 43-93]|nr:hypothetical protein [Bacteroidota bacterium]OJX01242.1 MAG: hypothetical protein BGO70_15835 [Bacteroidetes bacterium 43-93]
MITFGKVQAQSSTTVSGTIDISACMGLTITNLTGVVSFNDASDYMSGITITNAATIAVKSNVNWLIDISAQSAYFQAMSSGASTNMPASVLQIRRNGTTSYITMSTNSQTLKSGNKGDENTTGNSFNTDVSINPGFGYNAGSYNIGVLFTLSQQ